ncbi:MAG TPA: hypothetical protein VFV31_10320 [Chitinophagaceae bacterium]|nr:hypothetical protein [Chitinophagaceae bacterium]
MKNFIIGLLVVAAGAGVYFFVLRKKDKETKVAFSKEWVIGKWKADAGTDSVFSAYSYDFLKEGIILRAANDTLKADTLHYEWNKANALVWKDDTADSTGKTFTIIKLTQDSLQVQSADSVSILFTKLK